MKNELSLTALTLFSHGKDNNDLPITIKYKHTRPFGNNKLAEFWTLKNGTCIIHVVWEHVNDVPPRKQIYSASSEDSYIRRKIFGLFLL